MPIDKALLLAGPPDYISMSWAVIDAISEGDSSIADLCQLFGLTQGQFYRTTEKHADLKDAAHIARKIRAQRYADQALELARPAIDHASGQSLDWDKDEYGRYTANTGLIQRDSLRIKTLLHLAAKLDPEQFGDRVIEDVRGTTRAVLVIGDTEKAAKLIAEARLARLAAPQDPANDPNGPSPAPAPDDPHSPGKKPGTTKEAKE